MCTRLSAKGNRHSYGIAIDGWRRSKRFLKIVFVSEANKTDGQWPPLQGNSEFLYVGVSLH